MSLKRSAASAARWTAASSVVVALCQFLQISILAHLLTPADFGLTAIVMVALGFAQAYADMGISSAIIYRQDTTAEQLSSLYWLNVCSGFFASIAMIAVAFVLASLYSEPELRWLISYAAIIFLIIPWGQQFQTLLQKDLKFGVLGIIEASAALVALAVSTVAAYFGFRAASIIFGQIASAAALTGFLLVVGWARWKPALRFRKADLDGYLSFGLYQAGERTINFATTRTDQVLISAMLGPVALGYYSMAWNLIIQPVAKINPILTRVAFPLFARVQNEIDRLQRGYMLLIWLLSTVNAPILIGCAAVAPTLVVILLGPKWQPAIHIIQILAFAGWLRTIGNPIGSLLLAKGRADWGFKWDISIIWIQAPVLYISARLAGVDGVAVAIVALTTGYVAAMYIFLVRRLLGPCLAAYLKAMLPPFFISLLMGIAVYLVPHAIDLRPAFMLGLQVFLGTVIYALSTLLFERDRLHAAINAFRA